MNKPKNFDKIANTSIWWYSFIVGKQVEVITATSGFARVGMGTHEYSCIWLMELYTGSAAEYKMTHRMMLEIWWKQEMIHIHFIKEGDGEDGTIVDSLPMDMKVMQSYRTFVKYLNLIATRYQSKFWGK